MKKMIVFLCAAGVFMGVLWRVENHALEKERQAEQAAAKEASLQMKEKQPD